VLNVMRPNAGSRLPCSAPARSGRWIDGGSVRLRADHRSRPPRQSAGPQVLGRPILSRTPEGPGRDDPCITGGGVHFTLETSAVPAGFRQAVDCL
jgi:hypothetical protein